MKSSRRIKLAAAAEVEEKAKASLVEQRKKHLDEKKKLRNSLEIKIAAANESEELARAAEQRAMAMCWKFRRDWTR